MRLSVLRGIAFSAEMAILVALGLGALHLDAANNFLYGWNTAHLGYTTLVLVALALATIPPHPTTYYVVGLRLQAIATGGPAPRLHRFTRSLCFWVLVLAPSSLPVWLLSAIPGLSEREGYIARVAASLTLMILPAVSLTFTRGQASIHDFVAGTRVISSRPKSRGSANDVRSRVGRSLMAAGALGYAAVVSGVMLLDWRLRLTDVFPSYLEKRQQYVSEVIRGARANPSQAVDLFTQTAPSDNYWNLDRTAVLLGRTESFRFRISGAVLAGPRKRVAAAYDEVIAIVPILEPSTRWVAIQLYADHNFGPLLIEQGYEFIWDRSQKRLLYAPVRQDLFYHHAPTDTTPRDSILDSIITHFEPKLHGAIQLVSTGWQFPGLDFVARPASAPPKFVGAP